MGYCPSSETHWSKRPLEQLKDLESLLHYFHVELKELLGSIYESEQIMLMLANIDVAACGDVASKLNETMLKTTLKYYQEITAVAATKKKVVPESSQAWIRYSGNVTKKEAGKQQISPRILDFDEDTEALLTQQVQNTDTNDSTNELVMPWHVWWKNSVDLGSDAAAANAAVSVLHSASSAVAAGADSSQVR